MAIGALENCIFCGPGECQCITKKKPAKPRPKKKAAPSPPSGDAVPAERLARPEPTARKSTARPDRDKANLISNDRTKRSEEAAEFWRAMTVLFNEDMLHEISVRRSLDAYPSIPGGLYE